jgi:hypothetical protein
VSGKGAASPPLPYLRTVREGCPSYGSSRPLPSVLPEALSRMGRCVASGSVCRPIAGSHLTCPFGLHNPPGSCRVVYQAHVSRLSARATRPYPPGYDFPLPFGGWRSLLGPSCARCGLGPSFRRSSGLLAHRARPQRGYHVPHQLRRNGGGCLLYCAAWVPRRAAVKAACLCQTEDAVWFLAGSSSRQPSVATTNRFAASTEVHSHSPVPPFPHPVHLDGSGSPWASPACSRTPRYRGACAGREPT